MPEPIAYEDLDITEKIPLCQRCYKKVGFKFHNEVWLCKGCYKIAERKDIVH